MEKKHEKTITHIHIDMLRFQNDASLTDTNKDIVFFFLTRFSHAPEFQKNRWIHNELSQTFFVISRSISAHTISNCTREKETMETHTCLSLTCMAGQAKEMHGRTSKGLVGHAWKGPSGFSLTRKPHEKQNRAFTYFIDGKSDIVGYRQLDIICQFRLIYCRYVFHSYNVGTLVGPIFVQSTGRTMFVQCSYNGQKSSYNVRTIHH